MIFDHDQLELFDLDSETLNADSLRKKRHRLLLQWHPDKGGTNDMCVRGNLAYHNILDGLATFRAWCRYIPGLTLAQTIRPRPAPPASDLVSPPVLAPSFLAGEHCQLFASLEEALAQIHFSFE